jgi:predicted thioesterase
VVAGIVGSASLRATEEDTAISLGSGDVPVIGTPRLIALCEEASHRALAGRLAAGLTSVASRVQFDHLAPVGIGATVTAEATLERVEGRRLVFTVAVASHSDQRTGLVAAGRVTRVVVDRAAFLQKAGATGLPTA